MKAKISMLMDGELDDRELDAALAALARNDEACRAWRTYHLVRDALCGASVLGADFTAKVAARLAVEPTVLAPRSMAHSPARVRLMALSAAASVAAVALVGWLAFAPRPGSDAGSVATPIAQAPQVPAATAAKAQTPVRVPLPSSTDDYLLAHQGYSPRLTLQGVAPYIRTVSDEAIKSESR
ncbi:MAG TPA: sigma-E factor negative regulatory protein [Burkholderiales bacterium]|nr:sigma-E factor negative regulatory protein [Burkholderiales bacterium]